MKKKTEKTEGKKRGGGGGGIKENVSQYLFASFISQEFSRSERHPHLLTMSEGCCNLWAGNQGRYEWNLQLDLSKLVRMCVCVCM